MYPFSKKQQASSVYQHTPNELNQMAPSLLSRRGGLLAGFVVLLITGVLSVGSATLMQKMAIKPVAAPIFFDLSTHADALPQQPFPPMHLTARSAIVYDVARKEVLFAKNDTEQLPLASLTKLMTAVVAVSILPHGTSIRISDDDLSTEGDSGLLPNETWHFNDLLGFTLMASSNDGAHAIARAAGALLLSSEDTTATTTSRALFVKKMNEQAVRLGMKQTFFLNETGLDVSTTTSGAYGSARDFVSLLSSIASSSPVGVEKTEKPQAFFRSIDGVLHEAKNTDTAIADIPGLFASKTGYTDLAGGNLAILMDVGPAHPIAIVVLGSTVEGRFDDTKALATATLRYFSNTDYTQKNALDSSLNQ